MYLSESDFAKHLEQLLELRASGRAWLLLTSSAANFVFAVDASDEELRKAAQEVSEAVYAVITNVSPEDFAARRTGGPMEFFGIAEEPENTEVARRKLDLVLKRFPVDDLKRRRWLKRTSKTATPALFEWDVAVKHDEDTIHPPSNEPVPFGLIRIVARQPGSSADHSEQLALTVDSEDVEYLIGSLTALKARLGSLT